METGSVLKALERLNGKMIHSTDRPVITFEQFLYEAVKRPSIVLRTVFQVFHDMVIWYLGTGTDEYPNDPESIHYVHYDTTRLFEIETDRPFFADRLFANRLVSLIESVKRGAQQNKIYIFNGPPGCGKSTFLNNLLRKFEAYSNSDDGMRYELLWRLDPSVFGPMPEKDVLPILEQIASLLGEGTVHDPAHGYQLAATQNSVLEIPCPSHDHPLLIIPKDYREAFIDDLFGNDPFKEVLFTQKEYHWLFREKPCTFCSSLYRALLSKFGDPQIVHKMIFARHYRVNRRLGEGVTVFNPGDPPTKNDALYNAGIQRRLNNLLHNTSDVQYLYSRYAKTNNGVYALMDVKSHNTERLIELHNIISEGVHKVEDIEESVNSLLVAIMNPEDQKNVKEFRSFSDRIEYINIPYVMDLNTEVKIYKSIFGRQIEDRFLPRVLNNFARVIISSRLSTRSEALLEWIGDPRKYSLYCDDNLQLLKMEIYSGHIPQWLSEEDRKALSAIRRRKIIAESDREGVCGISGRDAIKIFNEFVSTYARKDKLINMSMLCDYFRKKSDLMRTIPSGFLDSLLRLYNYTVLQEVKESLYYYNEQQISREIQNYLFAINFDSKANEVCTYTNDRLIITEEFFAEIEYRILGAAVELERRKVFRDEIQREYASKTLTQEIFLEGKNITTTVVFKRLYEKYIQNLKEKVLDPFMDNDNFRRAVKDYETEEFKTYDKKIRTDVRYLLRNLRKKFGYTEQGAREACIYVIDNDLTRTFKTA